MARDQQGHFCFPDKNSREPQASADQNPFGCFCWRLSLHGRPFALVSPRTPQLQQTAEAFHLPLYAKQVQMNWMNEWLKKNYMCSRQPQISAQLWHSTDIPYCSIDLAWHYLLSDIRKYKDLKWRWALRSHEGKVEDWPKQCVASCTECLQEKRTRIKWSFI